MRKENFNINMDSIPDIKCECGSVEFQMAYQLKKLSPLQSPTGTKAVAALQTGYVCNSCRRLFDLEGNPIEKKEPTQPNENRESQSGYSS